MIKLKDLLKEGKTIKYKAKDWKKLDQEELEAEEKKKDL